MRDGRSEADRAAVLSDGLSKVSPALWRDETDSKSAKFHSRCGDGEMDSKSTRAMVGIDGLSKVSLALWS